MLHRRRHRRCRALPLRFLAVCRRSTVDRHFRRLHAENPLCGGRCIAVLYKAKAISWILAGGIISAIVGPQLAIFGKDLLAPVTFAGAFIALVPLGLVSIAILSFLKLPDPKTASTHAEEVRPLSEIVRTQRFVTGMICGIGSYALMTFMMTGAPLAMVVGCGFPTELATLGIQWHVLAMFAPSFFTGMLISRFGAEKLWQLASSC